VHPDPHREVDLAQRYDPGRRRPLVKTVTLGAGAKTTLTWALKLTTTDPKLVKVKVLKDGSVVAKLF